MMKPILTFLLGALIASGVVLYVVRRPDPPAAVQTAASQPPPAAQPATATPAPVVIPRDPTPAPPAPRPAPVRKQPAQSQRPVETARNPTPPPVQAAPPQAAPAPVQPAPQPEPAPAPVAPAPETRPAEPPPPPKPEPHSVTVSGGTLLNVRLNEALSSDKSQPGDRFTATLDQPLIVDGFVIAERGSRAEGRVVDTEKAGRVKGVGHLGIELVSLHTADGQKISFRTDTFEKSGPRSHGSDAAKVGAGAALGAIIGGIAGGGKGAAIGAGAGAGAGGGVVLATRGKPAVLPVETRISFRISQPVTITERLRY